MTRVNWRHLSGRSEDQLEEHDDDDEANDENDADGAEEEFEHEDLAVI